MPLLQLIVLRSRHRFSCRDIYYNLLQFSLVVPDVATSDPGTCTFEKEFLDVMTSAQAFGALLLLVEMSRHQSPCRDISFCCWWLHWLLLMSRLQLPCRDIILLHFCSFFSCFCLASCHELHHFSLNFHDVVTSELDCMDLQAASLTQQSDFNSALF